jgi:hypothetical protein
VRGLRTAGSRVLVLKENDAKSAIKQKLLEQKLS